MVDSRKILVIDDESSGTLTSHLLAADGYTVQSERDGAAGLRAFFSWRPDLVVLDVMMPRMDGWQVLDRIRELADTPILMLTGLGGGAGQGPGPAPWRRRLPGQALRQG